METIKIKIEKKPYKVLAARTEEERAQGLQEVEEMDNDEGCIFFYDEPQHVDFWMKDCDIPLDIIFFGEDKEVISVKKGEPNNEDFISEDNVKYVVELNAGSDVEPGDVLEVDSDDDYADDESDLELEPNTMYVIGSDGQPQAQLEGNERIFSRSNTRVIIRKAKKAYKTKQDSDYKSLGRYVFKAIEQQNKRKPEYVKAKTANENK